MRRFGLGFVLIGLLAVSAGAQEAVTIKVTRLKAGDRVRQTKTEKGTVTTSFVAGGQKQSKVDEPSKTVVWVDEVITAGDEKPTKLTRTYEKYEATKGQKGGDSTPPLNTLIVIEKKGDKYAYTVDGKPAEKPLADLLDGEFNKPATGLKSEDFMPKTPVKPGETWKPDLAKATKGLGGDTFLADTDKASMVCKLVSTSKRDGKLFGKIEIIADVPLKGFAAKGGPTMKSGGIKLNMTGDVCLDGTDPTEKGEGTMSVTIEAETMGVTFSVEAKMKMSETRELLPKK